MAISSVEFECYSFVKYCDSHHPTFHSSSVSKPTSSSHRNTTFGFNWKWTDIDFHATPPNCSITFSPAYWKPSRKELANLLSVSRKDPLPEWNFSNFEGNALDWNEWFGQFRSAVDASPLSDDVKMTYLKTLVSGKAKIAIEGLAYCRAMYKDALRALDRKFGQPQTVVSAHFDKLSAYPPVAHFGKYDTVRNRSSESCRCLLVFGI